MLSAILKIKPQLDQAEAKKMEKSLFDRFKNIGKTAKKTLKDVVTGGFLGFAVGLAQNMLSPIEDVENRMKAMFERAGDLKELADQFNTSAGKLQQLQTAALVNGLKPEQLKAMMLAFRETVDAAEEQILKKQPFDEKTATVKSFVGSKDMAEAFFTFIQSLKSVDQPNRDRIEKTLFGNVQYGGAKRFIENSSNQHFIDPNQNIANTDLATKILDDLNTKYAVKKEYQNTAEMYRYAGTVNESFLKRMTDYEDRQKDKEFRQLQSYADLAAARLTIDKISGVMDSLSLLLTKLVNYIGTFITWLEKSPAARGILKTIGVR